MSHCPRYFAAFAKQRSFIAFGLLGMILTSSVTLAEPTAEKLFSVRVVAREDDAGNKIQVTKQQVAQSVTVTKKRLAALGFPKPQIEEKGADGFIVRLEGLRPDQISGIDAYIQKVGNLELKEVSPRNDELGPDGKSLAQRVQDGTELVPGYRAYTHKSKDQDGKEFTRPILANRRTAIRSGDIASAVPSPQQTDAVAITLSSNGTDKMISLTKNMRPGQDRIAIMIDGEVISAPVVNQVPLGKQFIIEGLRAPGEVETLVVAFMNPLEFPLIVEDERTVPAQEKSK